MSSIVDWLTDDPVRATFLAALAISVVIIVAQARTPAANRRIAVWRTVLAALWISAVLGAGLVTRLDPDLQLCDSTTVTTEPAESEERTTDAAGTEVGEKTTQTAMTKQTTTTCRALGVPEIAVLSLPVLILISPMLKGFNIAGLFGMDFREIVEAKVQEQVIRVVVEGRIGAETARAYRQAEAGEVTDLPTA